MSQYKHILLVENDKRLSDLLKIILEAEGYIVDTSYSGEASLGKIEERHYSCIIMDYGLPDMKGDELTRGIRVNEPNVGIILVTGFKSELSSAVLQDFNFVLEKPVDPKTLLSVVKSLIKGTEV